MSFEDIKTAAVVIMAFMSSCVAVSGFVAACVKIYRWATKPTVDNSAEIEELKRRADDHDEKLDRDKRELNSIRKEIERQGEAQKECDSMLLGGILQIINYSIDGDNKPQLIEQRDKLNEYLINR